VTTPVLAAGPVAGRDYPSNLSEFDEFFASEESCRAYLELLRWPEEFVCPSCGVVGEPWRMSFGRLLCTSCRHQTSVIAGTIFEGTRKPLRLWFQAAWQVTSQKYGASALGVQRVLGVKSYETAWSWLHKFRRAMVRPGRDRLSGIIEVDETYVGGIEEGVAGRQTETKAIVAVAVEMNHGHIGRTRLMVVPDVTRDSLIGFVKEMVEPGSLVMTDGWAAYRTLEAEGFAHQVTNISAGADPAHVVMPGVHRVASLLKRWLLGTLQGSVSRIHLPYYLDEFTFRFNRRTSASRGLLFYRLLCQAVQTTHTRTDALFLGTGRGRAQHGYVARRLEKGPR
jgi:transposase-like protein